VSPGSVRAEGPTIPADVGVSFSEAGRTWRVLPFAVAAALPFLLAFLFGPVSASAGFIASGTLTALLIVVAFTVPWERVPVPLRATVPLAYFGAVFLLRNTSGPTMEYTPLVLLPVIWLALYGTRAQLIAALLALTLTLMLPILVIGAPRYPTTEWRRVVLFLAIAPIVGFTIQRLVAATRERAERLRASEAAVRANRDMLASVLRASTEHAIIGTEQSGMITVFNDGAERMLGYRATEMIGVETPEILHDPAEVAQRAQELGMAPSFGVLVATAPETRDWSYIRKDGARLTVAVSATPIQGPGAEPAGFICVAYDVTDVRTQATIRERELALTEQARQQLIEQNARLQEIDRMKDEFVALVSHELRTPLTSIAGYLEPLLDREAGPVTATQERFLRTIDRNARALSRIVGDLLFLASVDAGNLTLQTEDVDLAQVVTETVEACGPSADRRRIMLTVDTDEVPTVRGDRARLAQLTDNLLSNAIKFTPDGGHVEVQGREDGRNAVIEIRDSGVGIPADEIPNLFTRFYRATTATDHAISGTGLGLAIVKSITDAHHGAIQVDSSPGFGTTMRVLLPVGADED
jgi:PAS domain S-box-containing protein